MPRTPHRFSLSLFVLLLSFSFAHAADFPQWRGATEALRQDPTLIRHYTFQELQGQFIVDHVAEGEASVYGKNTLTILSNSPYGEPRTKYVVDRRSPHAYARWTEGRWPGKGALTTGLAKRSVVRSHFYGTESGDFTLLCWVRPHVYGKPNYSGALLHCGNGYKQGFRMEWTQAPWTPEGRVSMLVGTPEGTTTLHGPCKPGLWHCVVFTWTKGKAALYVDGKPANSEQFVQESIIWPRGSDHPINGLPMYDVGGLAIARAISQQGDAKADIDELAIWNRALPANEVAKLHQAGKPDAAPDEQLARLHTVQAEQVRLDRIELRIPADTFGYFHRDKPIPVTVLLPPDTGLKGDYTVRLSMVDLADREVLREEHPMAVEFIRQETFSTLIRQEHCGLYWLTIALLDAEGRTIKSQEYPIGITVPLPANEDVPLTSPLACHYMRNIPEHEVLGNKLDRMIRGWSGMEREEGVFHFDPEDRVLRQAEERGMGMLFCVDLRPPQWLGYAQGSENLPAEMAKLERFLRKLAGHFKGRVYCYEIFNEPNSGHGLKGEDRAKDYVTYLKTAYRIIKEVDPQAKVAAFSGVHRYKWFPEVMAHDPGDSYDIVTLHNYGALPIVLNRDRRLIQRVRQLLDENGRDDAELWNGECGFAQPARIGGRPITDEQIKEIYAGRHGMEHGVPVAPSWMALVSERHNACWQAQAILLDLAYGCDKYFMLSGGSHYSPFYNTDDGSPAEKGIAKAAVSSLLWDLKKLTRLELLSSEQEAVLIERGDDSYTLAAFSLEPSGLTVQVDRNGVFTGMDVLGNPLSWTARNNLLQLPLTEAPIYVFDVPKQIKEVPIVIVELDSDKLSASSALSGTLTLRNPWREPLDLDLAATLPADTTIDLASAHSLRGEQELKVPFVIQSRPLWPTWYRLGFTASRGEQVLSRAEAMFYSSGRVIQMPTVSAPIPLTADATGWPDNAHVATAAVVRHVVKGKPLDGVPGDAQWRGPNDLSFSVRTAWHEDSGLHFLLEVTDNAVVVAGEGQHWFQYDCLELFVDTRPVAEKTKDYSLGAQQFLVKPAVGDQAAECAVKPCGHSEKTVTVEAKGKLTATGYTIEGLIRPTRAHRRAFGPGQRVHLEFLVDDTDSPEAGRQRKAIMCLHSRHAKSSTDTSQWGAYELPVQGEADQSE